MNEFGFFFGLSAFLTELREYLYGASAMHDEERAWWVFDRARRVAAKVLKWKHRDAIEDVAQDTVIKVQERDDESEVTHGLVAKIARTTALKLAQREAKRPDVNSEHSTRLARENDPTTWDTVKELIRLLDEAPPVAMTPLHLEVVRLVRDGRSNKEIAETLKLDPRRVSKTKKEALAMLAEALRN